MPSELIELSGHIIDSWSLPRAWHLIMDRGGNFVLEEIRVGRRKTEPSYARLKVEAPNDEVLELILSELQQFGAVLLHGAEAQMVAVEQERAGSARAASPGRSRERRRSSRRSPGPARGP